MNTAPHQAKANNVNSMTRTISLLTAVTLVTLGFAGPARAAYTAGAARAPIDLPASLLPIDGFTTVLDPLEARVLVIGEDRRRIAIAVIDQTSLSAEDVAAMQRDVAAAARVAPDDVLVIASHTFSAPHMFAGHANPPPGMAIDAAETTRAQQYLANVRRAVVDASTGAAQNEVSATITAGIGHSAVAINRNVAMADGWWLGANESGPTDHTLTALRIDGADHRPIATLVNYGVQSSIMDHTGGATGTKAVTADLGGAAVQRVEADLGGTSLFLTGAAGDQMPVFSARHTEYDSAGHPTQVDLGAAGYPLVALEGERLGSAAAKAIASASHAVGPGLGLVHGTVSLISQERPRQLGQIKPTRSYTFRTGGPAPAPYVIVTLGDVAIVGVQVELNAATGAWIRAHSPFARTIVATMVNGAAKYLPDAQGYRRFTYEAINSSYAPGSAEVFARAIVSRLVKLKAHATR